MILNTIGKLFITPVIKNSTKFDHLTYTFFYKLQLKKSRATGINAQRSNKFLKLEAKYQTKKLH